MDFAGEDLVPLSGRAFTMTAMATYIAEAYSYEGFGSSGKYFAFLAKCASLAACQRLPSLKRPKLADTPEWCG